jgi:hypothetical protein
MGGIASCHDPGKRLLGAALLFVSTLRMAGSHVCGLTGMASFGELEGSRLCERHVWNLVKSRESLDLHNSSQAAQASLDVLDSLATSGSADVHNRDLPIKGTALQPQRGLSDHNPSSRCSLRRADQPSFRSPSRLSKLGNSTQQPSSHHTPKHQTTALTSRNAVRPTRGCICAAGKTTAVPSQRPRSACCHVCHGVASLLPFPGFSLFSHFQPFEPMPWCQVGSRASRGENAYVLRSGCPSANLTGVKMKRTGEWDENRHSQHSEPLFGRPVAKKCLRISGCLAKSRNLSKTLTATSERAQSAELQVRAGYCKAVHLAGPIISCKLSAPITNSAAACWTALSSANGHSRVIGRC